MLSTYSRSTLTAIAVAIALLISSTNVGEAALVTPDFDPSVHQSAAQMDSRADMAFRRVADAGTAANDAGDGGGDTAAEPADQAAGGDDQDQAAPDSSDESAEQGDNAANDQDAASPAEASGHNDTASAEEGSAQQDAAEPAATSEAAASSEASAATEQAVGEAQAEAGATVEEGVDGGVTVSAEANAEATVTIGPDAGEYTTETSSWSSSVVTEHGIRTEAHAVTEVRFDNVGISEPDAEPAREQIAEARSVAFSDGGTSPGRDYDGGAAELAAYAASGSSSTVVDSAAFSESLSY